MEETPSSLDAPTISQEGTSSRKQAAGPNLMICIHDILPPELLDNMFDIVRCINDSKAALFACSLVSRTWRKMTLRHRFHSLAFVLHDRRLSEPPYKRLFDFVESDVYRHVHASVRSLNLRWPSEFRNSIDPGFVTRIVNHFPSLQSLHLEGHMQGLSSRQEKAAQSCKPIIPSIRVLSLYEQTSLYDEVDSWSCLHLCALLRQFGPLDELWLQNDDGHVEENEVNLQNVPLPEVRVLRLRNIYSMGPMGAIIKQLAGQRSLERLDLRDYAERLQDVGGIVGCLDATPQHVRLNLVGWGEVEGVGLSWPWDLKRLTFVPELPIGLLDMAPNRAERERALLVNSSPWEEMIKALAAHDSRSLLERMNIHITVSDLTGPDELLMLKRGLDELSATVLDRFEKALLRLHKDARLKHVAVYFHKGILHQMDGFDYHQPCPEAAEYLRMLFPGLDALGILEV